MQPVPRPTTTPQRMYSCQGELMTVVRNAPVATVVRAPTVTARTPKRSINAAANGPVRPKRMRLIETARFQPNSFSRGTISTPGVARKPAEPSRAMNVTTATTQA